MAIKKVVYMLITEDYDLAQKIKEFLENTGGAWKLITKYYDENSKEPIKSTTETSRGK
jgi:hypothetical protein